MNFCLLKHRSKKLRNVQVYNTIPNVALPLAHRPEKNKLAGHLPIESEIIRTRLSGSVSFDQPTTIGAAARLGSRVSKTQQHVLEAAEKNQVCKREREMREREGESELLGQGIHEGTLERGIRPEGVTFDPAPQMLPSTLLDAKPLAGFTAPPLP